MHLLLKQHTLVCLSTATSCFHSNISKEKKKVYSLTVRQKKKRTKKKKKSSATISCCRCSHHITLLLICVKFNSGKLSFSLQLHMAQDPITVHRRRLLKMNDFHPLWWVAVSVNAGFDFPFIIQANPKLRVSTWQRHTSLPKSTARTNTFLLNYKWENWQTC